MSLDKNAQKRAKEISNKISQEMKEDPDWVSLVGVLCLEDITPDSATPQQVIELIKLILLDGRFFVAHLTDENIFVPLESTPEEIAEFVFSQEDPVIGMMQIFFEEEKERSKYI